MNDLEKFLVLLPHWIEHNTEHADELCTWAERIQFLGEEDAAESLLAAAASLQNAGEHLSTLLDEFGGMVGHDERQEHL